MIPCIVRYLGCGPLSKNGKWRLKGICILKMSSSWWPNCYLEGHSPKVSSPFLPAFCSDSEQVGPRKPWQKLSFCQACGRHEWSRRCGLISTGVGDLLRFSPPKKSPKNRSQVCPNTPWKFNSLPPKIYHPIPKRKGSSSKHHFSGANCSTSGG